MKNEIDEKIWKKGTAPIAVIMISLNEGHNIKEVLENLLGWAQEVHLVDSCSKDDTVSIALDYGVNVVQREFKGFGDQWNFAIDNLSISSPWVMKLDPDERITDKLKQSIEDIIKENKSNGVILKRRLHFMGKILPITQSILRIWKNGTCRFTNVVVNEHPIVNGTIVNASGYLEHHDSPNLDHWIAKQNSYTTSEAINQYLDKPLGFKPKLFRSAIERRMWIKTYFWKIPGRYFFLFNYHFLILGAFRSGKVGWKWSHLRTEVYRLWEYKYFEMKSLGRATTRIESQKGEPDNRVRFYKDD